MDTWTYKQQLDWLSKLSKEPGWKAYAWRRAKDLSEIDVYQGIDKDLERSMKNWNDEQKKAGG